MIGVDDPAMAALNFDDPTSNLAMFADHLALAEEPDKGVREIAAVANAFMGAMVIPTLLRSHSNAPVRPLTILLSAIAGGFLGYWKPMPITLIQGLTLVTEI